MSTAKFFFPFSFFFFFPAPRYDAYRHVLRACSLITGSPKGERKLFKISAISTTKKEEKFHQVASRLTFSRTISYFFLSLTFQITHVVHAPRNAIYRPFAQVHISVRSRKGRAVVFFGSSSFREACRALGLCFFPSGLHGFDGALYLAERPVWGTVSFRPRGLDGVDEKQRGRGNYSLTLLLYGYIDVELRQKTRE